VAMIGEARNGRVEELVMGGGACDGRRRQATDFGDRGRTTVGIAPFLSRPSAHKMGMQDQVLLGTALLPGRQ
jgi:hypothetical protein